MNMNNGHKCSAPLLYSIETYDILSMVFHKYHMNYRHRCSVPFLNEIETYGILCIVFHKFYIQTKIEYRIM